MCLMGWVGTKSNEKEKPPLLPDVGQMEVTNPRKGSCYNLVCAVARTPSIG